MDSFNNGPEILRLRTLSSYQHIRCTSIYQSPEDVDNAEPTRQALVALIEESWARVTQLTTQSILMQCEEELRSATSLLVLATVRRAAEYSATSKATVQSMFRKADVNNDGQLSFMEWYEWLGSSSSSSTANPAFTSPGRDPTTATAPPLPPSAPAMTADPMIASLQQVLSQAVCALKISARVQSNREDPLALTAAFIAGGMMTGVMDGDICRTMLARLSPRTRELVTMALTLESAAISAPLTDSSLLLLDQRKSTTMEEVGPSVDRKPGAARGKRKSLFRPSPQRTIEAKSVGKVVPTTAEILPGAVPRPASQVPHIAHRTSVAVSSNDFIQRVDLSYIAATTAPPIDSPVLPADSETESVLKMAADVSAEDAGEADGDERGLFRSEGAMLREGEGDYELVLRSSLPSHPTGALVSSKGAGAFDAEVGGRSPTAGYSSHLTERIDAAGLDQVLSRVAAVADEINELRLRLEDLEDSNSAVMRQLLMRKSEGRRDVSTLAMALRATRLQHVTRKPVHLKHQLAVETLQLWAPLSFQVGVAAQMPELEVHSYVLLFPRSFSSFVNWYTQLRPIAKRLLSNFRGELEKKLEMDALMPLLAAKVTLQSRFKNPSSAFKKMVKSSKDKDKLHDMLGMRVIVKQRTFSLQPAEFDGSDWESAEDWAEGYGAAGEGFIDVDMPAEAEAKVEAETETATETVATSDPPEASSDPDVGAWSDRRAAEHQELEDWESTTGGDDTADWTSPILDYKQEETAIWRAYELITAVSGWTEDKSRFKDYVTHPKPSGYQSLHVTLVHEATEMSMEVQIRSQRMHERAESGPAAHNRYKALLFPPLAAASQEP